jgi:hypothetical protein
VWLDARSMLRRGWQIRVLSSQAGS